MKLFLQYADFTLYCDGDDLSKTSYRDVEPFRRLSVPSRTRGMWGMFQ